MGFREWTRSEVGHRRKPVSSGLEGTRSRGEAFLDRILLTPVLGKSMQKVSKPAVAAACIAILSAGPGRRRERSIGRMLAFGLLGGALGLGAGIPLTMSFPG